MFFSSSILTTPLLDMVHILLVNTRYPASIGTVRSQFGDRFPEG